MPSRADVDLDPIRAARITARLLFFVTAAVLLLVVCRAGAPFLGIVAAVVAYLVAATLWVRGQAQAAVEAAADPSRPAAERRGLWTPPFRVTIAGLVAAVIVFVVGVISDIGWLFLLGLIATLFFVGYLLARIRRAASPKNQVVLGGVVVVASAVLAAAGLRQMADHWWMTIALAAGIFVAPIGMGLLAEAAVTWTRDNSNRWWWRGCVVVGLVVFGLAAWNASEAVGTGWTWMFTAFIALGLLVIAIVSSTQADIAFVIGLIALLGVTPMQEKPPDDLDPDKGDARVLVALGDSYMSGEGADIFYEGTDNAGPDDTNLCHRAPTAWAALAGQTDRLFDSVAFLACSGARTYNVRHTVDDEGSEEDAELTGKAPEPHEQYEGEGTQLDQVDELQEEMGPGFKPALVVVSLGGNDAGFSTIGAMCLAPGDCGTQESLWTGNLSKVESELVATFQEIREEFPDSPVVVTAYPDPLYESGDQTDTDGVEGTAGFDSTAALEGDATADAPAGEPGDEGAPADCSKVALGMGDRDFVGEFLGDLNEHVHDAAEFVGFYYMGEMAHALEFAHLQLCDPENDNRPGLNFIGLRSVNGIAGQRFNPANWYHNSLHPNERGHAALLQVFEQWLADHPKLEPVDPEADTGVVKTAGAITNPPCDLAGRPEVGVKCKKVAGAWIREQIGVTFLENGWGLRVAFAVTGAWLFAVGVFGAVRPNRPRRFWFFGTMLGPVPPEKDTVSPAPDQNPRPCA